MQGLWLSALLDSMEITGSGYLQKDSSCSESAAGPAGENNSPRAHQNAHSAAAVSPSHRKPRTHMPVTCPQGPRTCSQEGQLSRGPRPRALRWTCNEENSAENWVQTPLPPKFLNIKIRPFSVSKEVSKYSSWITTFRSGPASAQKHMCTGGNRARQHTPGSARTGPAQAVLCFRARH